MTNYIYKYLSIFFIFLGIIIIGFTSNTLINHQYHLVNNLNNLSKKNKIILSIDYFDFESNNITNKNLKNMIFDTLFILDENKKVSSNLLEKWTYNISKNQYLFYLKKNIYFHNNKTVTSHDLVFSIQKWIKNNPEKTKIKHFNVVSIDNYIFTILFDKIKIDNFLDLTKDEIFIYINNYDNSTKKEYFSKPVGTGPYLVDNFNGSILELSAFEKYNHGKAVTNYITIYNKPKGDQILINLQQKNIKKMNSNISNVKINHNFLIQNWHTIFIKD